MNTILLFVLLSSLALSFFLSGMEAGVFALNRLRIRRLAKSGNTRARLLYGYLENPENFFWTILIGNTLANLTAVILVMVLLEEYLSRSPILFWVLFVMGGLLFYGFCELLPKMLFRLHPNRLCLLLSRPFGFVHFLLQPLVWVVEQIAAAVLHFSGGKTFTGHLFGNREELRLVMQESAQALTSEERRMVNRVLDLQNISVRQITVPMSNVISVETDSPVADVLRLCRDNRVSRLPVWKKEHGRPRVAGLVDLRAILYQTEDDRKRTAGEYLKSAIFVAEDTRLEDALRHLQRSGQRMAIVLSRDRREIGLLSLSDILKVVFGETVL